jgi:hypothetical protein
VIILLPPKLLVSCQLILPKVERLMTHCSKYGICVLLRNYPWCWLLTLLPFFFLVGGLERQHGLHTVMARPLALFFLTSIVELADAAGRWTLCGLGQIYCSIFLSNDGPLSNHSTRLVSYLFSKVRWTYETGWTSRSDASSSSTSSRHYHSLWCYGLERRT